MKILVISLLTLLSFPTFGMGQDAELKSSKAKAAVREYERRLADVDKEFETQLAELEKSYQMKAELVRARLLSNLNEAMKEEARKVNLEEANKIDAELKRYKAMPLPNLVQTDGSGGEMSKADFLELIKGEWIGEWGTTGRKVYFSIETDRKGIKKFISRKIDGSLYDVLSSPGEIRKIVKADGTHENGAWSLFGYSNRAGLDFAQQAMPFGNQGNHLLFLQWDRFETDRKNVLTDTPDHVTILKKK